MRIVLIYIYIFFSGKGPRVFYKDTRPISQGGGGVMNSDNIFEARAFAYSSHKVNYDTIIIKQSSLRKLMNFDRGIPFHLFREQGSFQPGINTIEWVAVNFMTPVFLHEMAHTRYIAGLYTKLGETSLSFFLSFFLKLWITWDFHW